MVYSDLYCYMFWPMVDIYIWMITKRHKKKLILHTSCTKDRRLSIFTNISFKNAHYTSQEISIDEQMIGMKLRVTFIVSHFLGNFFSSRSTLRKFNVLQKGSSTCHHQFSKPLFIKSLSPILIYFDNFYTTHKSLKNLQSQQALI